MYSSDGHRSEGDRDLESRTHVQTIDYKQLAGTLILLIEAFLRNFPNINALDPALYQMVPMDLEQICPSMVYIKQISTSASPKAER